jgi:hypothetical protein
MRFGAQREDRVFEHRLVQFETDLADMAGLFVAHEIAGTANVQVMAGELEACAPRLSRSDKTFSRFSAASPSICGPVGMVR